MKTTQHKWGKSPSGDGYCITDPDGLIVADHLSEDDAQGIAAALNNDHDGRRRDKYKLQRLSGGRYTILEAASDYVAQILADELVRRAQRNGYRKGFQLIRLDGQQALVAVYGKERAQR